MIYARDGGLRLEKQGAFKSALKSGDRSRFRLIALGAYMQNLIAWGDMLFVASTNEAQSGAVAEYGAAQQILGPPPRPGSASHRLVLEIPDVAAAWRFNAALRSGKSLDYEIEFSRTDLQGVRRRTRTLRLLKSALLCCAARPRFGSTAFPRLDLTLRAERVEGLSAPADLRGP